MKMTKKNLAKLAKRNAKLLDTLPSGLRTFKVTRGRWNKDTGRVETVVVTVQALSGAEATSMASGGA